MCVYICMYIYIYIYISISLSLYIYIYIYIYVAALPRGGGWVFIKGGCSGRGVQWMGVVLCSKIVHNTIQITTPCFHCTPPLQHVEGSTVWGMRG